MSPSSTDNEIAEAFEPAAKKIGARMSQRTGGRMSAEDLAQVALIAAIPAFRRFNPDRGTPLASWVGTKMRFAASTAVQTEMQGRRVVGRADFTIFSLDYPIRGEDGSTVGAGYVLDDPWPAIEAAIDVDILARGIGKRERDIAMRRAAGDTNGEIGADYRLTKGRVSQICTSALKTMRAAA